MDEVVGKQPVPDQEEGWFPDPEQEGQERFWDGEGWTDEVRPDGSEDSHLDHLPEHVPELQRALAAATADIDSVEDRLSTLFDRSEAAPGQTPRPRPPRTPRLVPAEALEQGDDGADDDSSDDGADDDTATATSCCSRTSTRRRRSSRTRAKNSRPKRTTTTMMMMTSSPTWTRRSRPRLLKSSDARRGVGHGASGRRRPERRAAAEARNGPGYESVGTAVTRRAR